MTYQLPDEDNYRYALVLRIARRIFQAASAGGGKDWVSFPTITQQRVQQKYINLAREVIREVHSETAR